MTAEVRCSCCGELIQAATEIPALGYVRNVTARQLWPHKKVEVCYTLADDIGEVANAGTALILTGKYGSTTKTASRKVGATSCVPGMHCVVWDFEGDSIAVNQSSMTFTVKYGSVSATSSGIAINTSSTVKNGMSVEKTMALAYSPIDTVVCEIEIDGTTVLSSTNFSTFVWQLRTKGEHTITHIAGTNVWTRIVNVTSLVHGLPSPNPGRDPDSNISLTATERNLTTSAAANGAIQTKGSGSCTASTTEDWITIASPTRNAGVPIPYSIAENLGVETRTGYVYVNGHVYTITQPGNGAELSADFADFEANGGTGSLSVIAGAQATWHAWSNVDWISVETTEGTGEDTVRFVVAPYNAVTTRSGTITVAGRTFTVNQTGRHMQLNAVEITKDYLAHDIVLTVDALSSTNWGIALDAPWLSVVDGGTGHGGGTLTLAINENPSYLPRTATALVGTETLIIHQQGRPTEALAFALSPEQTTASVKGANGLVAVTATPDLPWAATSQANWLTVMPGTVTGAGNGNVVYTASPNPTMTERTGTIRVTPVPVSGLASLVHTVTQPAAVATISPSNHVFAASGDSFEVAVTVDEVVGWTISGGAQGLSALPGWVSVVGGLSRTGPGTVTITVEQNLTIDPREAVVTIAGHAFVVRQRGQELVLDYEQKIFAPESYEEAYIDVIPDGDVSWTAVPSDLSWIVIWGADGNCATEADGNVYGTGSATIGYMLLPYAGNGEARTGWITIGDKKVYVTQRAYDFWIDPCAADVPGNAGEGEIAVPATAGQIWEAIATEPWITVIEGAEGTGPGTVRYTFTDNDTGVTRTGKIIIAGEEYEVRQAARLRAEIQVKVEGEGEVAGAGTYNRGESVTLTATAAEGWRFAGWYSGATSGEATSSSLLNKEGASSLRSDGDVASPTGCVSTENPWTFAADADISLVAVFERIPVYSVNGEAVREGTVKSFAAPEPVVLGGTTQLVCRGTSAYPEKGASFSLTISGDVAFEWDLWTTNYWVDVAQSAGGTVSGAAGVRALPGWVEAGATVEVTATPAAGYSLMRWQVGEATSSSLLNKVGASSLRSDGDVASPLVLRASAPLTVSAVFAVFNDTLATAADAPALTFRTGGDAVWTPVIDPMAETGYTSVRSGVVGAESETWLETTVSCTGMLSFNWRVDCERDDSGAAEWDRLTVFTNGVEAARIDGQTGWQRVTLPLTAPKTTIRWSFYRDDHDEVGAVHENAAWIDGVEVR